MAGKPGRVRCQDLLCCARAVSDSIASGKYAPRSENKSVPAANLSLTSHSKRRFGSSLLLLPQTWWRRRTNFFCCHQNDQCAAGSPICRRSSRRVGGSQGIPLWQVITALTVRAVILDKDVWRVRRAQYKSHRPLYEAVGDAFILNEVAVKEGSSRRT